jgi:hypothetical protein
MEKRQSQKSEWPRQIATQDYVVRIFCTSVTNAKLDAVIIRIKNKIPLKYRDTFFFTPRRDFMRG